MNTNMKKSDNWSISDGWMTVTLAVIVMVIGALVSGCAYNRKTEGGALAEVTFGLKVLPSKGSDDTVMLGNKTVETVVTNDDNTNCHSAYRATGSAGKQEGEAVSGEEVIAKEAQEPLANSSAVRGRSNVRN